MKDNGEPAFPSGNQVRVGEYMTGGHTGMTLRDWFAGQALSGIEAAQGVGGEFITTDEGVAARAYRLADAMLKEREK